LKSERMTEPQKMYHMHSTNLLLSLFDSDYHTEHSPSINTQTLYAKKRIALHARGRKSGLGNFYR
jgi:hypothetical protein